MAKMNVPTLGRSKDLAILIGAASGYVKAVYVQKNSEDAELLK